MMQDKGLITKEPVRDLQWIIARIMAVFSTALRTYAIRFGTHDWSVTVQKSLDLLIQSTCTNRSG
jgi:hypothetical protein